MVAYYNQWMVKNLLASHAAAAKAYGDEPTGDQLAGSERAARRETGGPSSFPHPVGCPDPV